MRQLLSMYRGMYIWPAIRKCMRTIFFYSSRNIIAYIMYYFSSMYAIICRACLTHRQDTSCKPAIMPYGHGDGRIVVYETTSTVLEVGEEIILHSCKSINGGDKSLST